MAMFTGIMNKNPFFYLIFLFLTNPSSSSINAEPIQDRQILLSFISLVPHSNRIQWHSNQSACNWVGVGCDANHSSVLSLRLPGSGFVGPIPANTIGKLSQLRVLSLRSNRFTGQIPSDFSNLKLLRSLYLQGNNFSGDFPITILDLTHLTRLDLSTNNFTGSVPFSINNLTHLTGLFLEKNGFSGNLPSDIPSTLVNFNISNNHLNGSIPTTFSSFPASAFAGNDDLCGLPLQSCNPFFPSPASPSPISPPEKPTLMKSRNLSKASIVAISIGSGVLILLLLLLLVLCFRRKQRRVVSQKPPATVRSAAAEAGGSMIETGTSSTSKDDIVGSSVEERNKLVFFEGLNYSFDLEDLLRASAEVLGKGTVGTSYKAVLEEGTAVVVKRVKDVILSKRDFLIQMEILGKIRHDNVVSLMAYYYSTDEKLLVSDYVPAGSLSSLLHGNRSSGRAPLDWDNRITIGLSVARGLAHLHVTENIVHGNIKASNVLLRHNYDAAVSDFGLNPLFGNTSPPNRAAAAAGYRAPELMANLKPTLESDVYSYGVLLLELLTGKSPNQSSIGGDESVDLPRWVQSVVREEWTAEVFDVDLMRYENGVEEEMVQLLQIAMACVSHVPNQRPLMKDVLRLMEEMMNRLQIIRQSSDEQPSKESDGQTTPRDVTP
ncbi:probable inactive receptor kinase At2g26730 [Impatiens glandulifera]|uniref:probable inactive receptor kinase At2g26730 n=1 Tax=Impatiens glandulifera TaxID=253017 RepID=UPI001FB0F28E|nr:probable inactive receptor kinase At2g26730 [Impatiens glandulifera]